MRDMAAVASPMSSFAKTPLPSPRHLSAVYHAKSASSLSFSRRTRYSQRISIKSRLKCAAASASDGSTRSDDDNPYQILGVNPLERFEKVKTAYTRQYNDAKRRGDDSAMARLERAYDSIMMKQLSNRKQGVTYGSFKVSKDVRYADKRPLFPWGPRYSVSSKKIILSNFVCSAILVCWAAVLRTTNWKPLQFLIFYYFGQMFWKLRSREPNVSTEFLDDAEEEKTLMKTGKIVLRSLGLVFGCIVISSFAYTGILNIIEYTLSYVPLFAVNNQELIVTAASALYLFITASFYR